MSENDWDSVVDTNLKGTFNCIKAVLPYMLKNKTAVRWYCQPINFNVS